MKLTFQACFFVFSIWLGDTLGWLIILACIIMRLQLFSVHRIGFIDDLASQPARAFVQEFSKTYRRHTRQQTSRGETNRAEGTATTHRIPWYLSGSFFHASVVHPKLPRMQHLFNHLNDDSGRCEEHWSVCLLDRWNFELPMLRAVRSCNPIFFFSYALHS